MEVIICPDGGKGIRRVDPLVRGCTRAARWRAFTCVVVLLALAGGCQRAPRDPTQVAAERAMNRAQPAVVQIKAVLKNYTAGREVKSLSVGSGFIITRKGYVVTNHHVAGRAGRLVCVLSDNEEVTAELIGSDPLTDIAVLKLAARKDNRPYPTVTFGDSAAVKVGDTVLAMGSPLAMSQTTTRGVISNTKMIMPGSFRGFAQFTLEGEEVGALVRWLTHDALIFPGNSGGPLLNLRGEVIGVNEISFGLGGAIPGQLARLVAEEIIAHGRVRRAWLGLEVQPLLKASGRTNGLLVAGVAPDSPAAQAGIVSGDILLRLGGRDATIRFDEEIPLFNQQVAALPIGTNLELVVSRAGAERTVNLSTVEREPMWPATSEFVEWGITARNLNTPVAQELRLTETRGVLITSVGANGPGTTAKPSLAPLDVIRRVNDQPVDSLARLQELTHQITGATNEPVATLVEIERQGQNILSVIKLGIRPPEPPGSQAHKAWLAVDVQAINREMAKQLGSNSLAGVRLTRVHPDSAAAAAGLKVGDLVLALDGEPVAVSASGEEANFLSRIRRFPIGSAVKLSVQRAGVVTNLVVTLEQSRATEPEMERYQDLNFEFTARELTFDDRVRLGLRADLSAVIATEVTPGGWAALGGLAAGDLIVTVNDQVAGTAAELKTAMQEVATNRPDRVVFGIRRGIHSRYLELEAEWPTDSTASATNKQTKGQSK